MTTIFRTKLSSAFTILPNTTLRDSNLSFRARGLLAFILSNASEWEVSKAWLREQGKEGVQAINSALKELLNLGYAEKVLERSKESGRFSSMVWVFRDIPVPVSNGSVHNVGTRTPEPPPADTGVQRSNKGKKNQPKEEPIPPTPKPLRASLAGDSSESVDRLIQLWKEAWREKNQFDYADLAKDRKRASALLASGSLRPEDVVDVARRAFNAPPTCWASSNLTGELSVFCQSFNRIRKEVDSLVPRRAVTDFTKF